MTSNGVALAALVILLFPMGFFLMSAPAFLLVKLDIPEVTTLLRGVFAAYFLMNKIAGIFATIAFLLAGRPVLAIIAACVTALAIYGRGWFLQRFDTQMGARDAGDKCAVVRLRKLHWGGMLSNAVQLVIIAGGIPFFMSS